MSKGGELEMCGTILRGASTLSSFFYRSGYGRLIPELAVDEWHVLSCKGVCNSSSLVSPSLKAVRPPSRPQTCSDFPSDLPGSFSDEVSTVFDACMNHVLLLVLVDMQETGS